MKKLYAFFVLAFAANHFVSAQTVLYTNNLDNANSITLDAPSSFNNWVINNVYQGGLNFVSGTMIPNVPSQPTSISNPNQNYLHPVSPLALNTSFQPILNANYLAGGGFSNMKAVMNTSVDASNYTNVTFSFWRVGGLNGMKVIYSTNGGQTWTDAGLSFQGSPSSWTQESITIPALNGQSNIRFGFELIEMELADPAPNAYHSIDELKITATPVPTGEITTSVTISGAAICSGQSITVNYQVTNGSINTGNVFNLELSNELGSFASPIVIGNLTSSAMSGSVTGVIPSGVSGSGFRLRVSSTNVAITGNDNGSNFTITPSPDAPTITMIGSTGQLQVNTNATSYQWFFFGNPVPNSQNQPTIMPNANGGYTVVASNGVCETTSSIFVVNYVNLDNSALRTIEIFPNPFQEAIHVNYFEQEVREIAVFDLLGNLVFHSDKPLTFMSLEFLQQGVYSIHLIGATTQQIKVIKR